jgi:hypothetical protein
MNAVRPADVAVDSILGVLVLGGLIGGVVTRSPSRRAAEGVGEDESDRAKAPSVS